MAPAEIFEDTAYGTDIKRIRGQGSAAVEVPPFNLAAGDTVHIRFEYKTGTPKTAIVLCTIGDATNPLRVELAADGTIVARDNTGHVHSVAAHQPQVYTPVELAVSKTHAVISVNGTEARFNRSFNPARFFLGQGYLEKRDPSTQTFLCRISSVKTRVQRP
ncbi:MAG: hypothetical protein K9M45_04970 [Kiritimatiellales bacterium]|nr:hypothetical protein [Kiritimatiellales bacterium]